MQLCWLSPCMHAPATHEFGGEMAARATRSASRKAVSTSSGSDDASRCLLLALSHDELGVIFDGLADPLQPVVAVALSSTCQGLRTPLRAALEVLAERHVRAKALCRKVSKPHVRCSSAVLRDAEVLIWSDEDLTANDMATLGMILHTKGLPQLRTLYLNGNQFCDAGMQMLCEAVGHGAAPSLCDLFLGENRFGPAGAKALAAALGRGALPKLETLWLSHNPIGNQGVAALATSLRNLPLKDLNLVNCKIDDEGLASLLANLGKDDFKKLEKLFLTYNEVTLKSCRTLVSVINDGGLPALKKGGVFTNDSPATEEGAGQKAVVDALSARAGRA